MKKGSPGIRNLLCEAASRNPGHLEAIARANRLFDGKDLGYIIEYLGILVNLDNALDLYSKLPECDAE